MQARPFPCTVDAINLNLEVSEGEILIGRKIVWNSNKIAICINHVLQDGFCHMHWRERVSE